MCCGWDPDPPNILESDKVTFSQSCQRQLQVMLLLFGHVMLFYGKFLFIKLSEGPVQLPECTITTPLLCTAGLSVHTGSVRQ